MKTIGKIIWFISSGLVYFFYKNDAYCTSQYIVTPTYNGGIDTADIHVETYTTDLTRCDEVGKCTFNANRVGATTTSPTGCGKNMYFVSCGSFATNNASCPDKAICSACPDNGVTMNNGFVAIKSITRTTCCHHWPSGKSTPNLTSYVIRYTVRTQHTINNISDCYLPKGTSYTEKPGHTYKFDNNCYYK